jgi:hypothetical protein
MIPADFDESAGFRRSYYVATRIPEFGAIRHTLPMNLALILLSVAVLGSVGVGGVMMIFGLRNAPEGYEDENGFHCGQPVEALVPNAAPDFAACLEEELVYANR